MPQVLLHLKILNSKLIKSIAILNKSSVVSNADVIKMTSACNIQLSRDVAPAWGRAVIPVNFYSDERTVPTTASKIYIFDNSDQAGALGYHDETVNGVVYGRIFAKTIINYGFRVLYDANNITVSSVLSHEVIELFCDPYVDLWADGTPISQGSQYAYEACDAVEANVYQITVSTRPNVVVTVSNFLYPEYFDTASPRNAKLDHMGLLTAPFTMTPYGYMIVRNNAGIETALYGATYPEALKEMHKNQTT